MGGYEDHLSGANQPALGPLLSGVSSSRARSGVTEFEFSTRRPPSQWRPFTRIDGFDVVTPQRQLINERRPSRSQRLRCKSN